MKLQLSQVNWSEMFKGKDVNACWTLFKDIVHDMIQKYVPLASPPGDKKNINNGTSLRRRTVKMIKSRNVCWKKYRSCPTHQNYNEYKRQRNKVQTFINEDKDSNRKRLIKSC